MSGLVLWSSLQRTDCRKRRMAKGDRMVAEAARRCMRRGVMTLGRKDHFFEIGERGRGISLLRLDLVCCVY